MQKHRREDISGEISNVTTHNDTIDVTNTKCAEETIGQVKKAVHHIEQKARREGRTSVEVQFDRMMARMIVAAIDVAEVYSPPRVAQVAREMGFRGGWSLDLTTSESGGRQWDFNQLEMRNRAARLILKDRPLLLIGSPMCTVYSCMNRINHARMSPEEVKESFKYARKHLEFVAKLYQMQIDAGRYFLHGHPHTASSWEEPRIRSILKNQDVVKVVGDQCMYGLKVRDKEREGPAQKRTGFMTNSMCIAQQLMQRCPNKKGFEVHRHVRLENGRTRDAQTYPQELCRAICIGIQKQIRADTSGQFLLMEVENEETNSKDLMNASRELEAKRRIVEEPLDASLEQAWDDVSGAELNPSQVKAARAEETEYIHKMKFYEKVPIAECHKKTGKDPIAIRWIDINKGDNQSPNYRSRLVAREINICKRNDFFAATFPLEALKMVLSMTATANKGEIIMVNDISGAFFHARVKRDVYVHLPNEDRGPGEDNFVES